MSWGVDVNLDGTNNGFSWQTGNQSTGWEDVVSGTSASGWGPVQRDSPTLPSTSSSRTMDDGNQDKERKASSSASMITGWEPVLADPIKEQKRGSISIQLPRRQSSTSTNEQSAPIQALKENNEAGRAPSVTPTELSSIGSGSRSHLKFSDAMQAFDCTVKTLQDAVRLQIEYSQASAEVDQWRRTQNSEAYSHPTLATRKKLEERRAEIGLRQGDAQKMLKTNVGTLAYISSPLASNIRYIINDIEMTRFRNELKEWMQQVSQHLDMQEKQEKEPEQQPVEEPAEDVEPEQQSAFLKQPEQWTLDDIAKALAELDSRAEALAEEVYCEDERPNLLDEALVNEMEAKKGQFVENEHSSLRDLVVRYEEQHQQIDNRLLVSAEKVTALLQERARLKNEMEASLALYGTLSAMHKELTDQVEESERLMTQDEEQLVELTRSVQNMLTARPPSPKTNLDTDELLPQLQARIIPHLTDELGPVVQYFKSACLQHDEAAQAVVDKIVQFIASRTDDVAKAAQARTKAEAIQL
ncbi:hypothetical protein JOM56_006603 [Amanita muscaria]